MLAHGLGGSMQLKIIYKKKEKIDENLDQKIERALEPLGFKRWASGYDLTTGERDLAFDDEN